MQEKIIKTDKNNKIDDKRRGLFQIGGITAGIGMLGAISNSVNAASSSVNTTSPSSTFFNVKDFGAVGDGINNDGGAIEAAINAASLLTGTESQKNLRGGVVYLPAGIYLVNHIKVRRNITLMGEGPGTIVKQTDTINAAVITTHSATEYPIIIRNLRIQGARNPSGNGQYARGIVLKSTSEFGGFTVPDGQHIIDQVWIERTHSDGIYINRDCRGTIIKDCWVSSSKTKSGIWVDGSDSTIVNTVSRSHENVQGNGNGGVGFKITAGNIRMMNCKAFFCRGGGFYYTGSRGHLSVCEAQDNWFDGFYLSSSDTMISGCLADSNQNAGFHIDPRDGYLGGISMNGFTSFGRNEVQANKPWVGQDIGLLMSPGNINDSYFAGIVRNNNNPDQLQINAELNAVTQTQNIING